MPKVHDIGPDRFFQYIDFPVKWGWKLYVRGWTQEIAEPFRSAKPIIVRLPFHKALVFGKWTGMKTEEEALSSALEMRVLTDEDFSEDKGWTPAPEQDREKSCEHSDSRPSDVGRECAVCYWQGSYSLDEGQKRELT